MTGVTTKKGDTPRLFVAGPWAFLPVCRAGTKQALLYCKVPAAVVYVPCLACGAVAGERCKFQRGYGVTCHVGRSKFFQSWKRKQDPCAVAPVNLGPVEMS